MYAKKLLTTPVCVARLDYQALFDTHSSDVITATVPEEPTRRCTQTSMPVIASGTCHCVAMWVDLEVSSETTIEYWATESCQDSEEVCNFPPYLKTNVKFFEAKQPTAAATDSTTGGGGNGVVGMVVAANSFIQCTTEFDVNSAMINFDFEF